MKNAKFYEDLIDKTLDKYNNGVYAQRNQLLVEMLREFQPQRILEIAGAEGNLMKLILEQIDSVEVYHFTDFVQRYLDIAWNNVNNISNKRYSIFRFDAEKDYDKIDFGFYDCLISTSFEHISTDLEILKRLRSGTVVLLSLPDFWSEGHVIWFPTKELVYDRYGKYLRIVRFNEFRGCNGRLWRLREILYKVRRNRLIDTLTRALGIEIKGNWHKWNLMGIRRG